MLFQIDPPIVFILRIILAIVIFILFLILYIAKKKTSDNFYLIIILALIFVLTLPIILNAINSVLSVTGYLIAFSGSEYLTLLSPIVGFIYILILIKYIIRIPWDQAVWISLLTILFLFLLYTMIPELYSFLGFGT